MSQPQNENAHMRPMTVSVSFSSMPLNRGEGPMERIGLGALGFPALGGLGGLGALGGLGGIWEEFLAGGGNRPPPRASSEVVRNLPVTTVTETSTDDGCAVCQDNFEAGQSMTTLPCTHGFHPDCLRPWLSSHNTCPTCRYELDTNNAEYNARIRRDRGEAPLPEEEAAAVPTAESGGTDTGSTDSTSTTGTTGTNALDTTNSSTDNDTTTPTTPTTTAQAVHVGVVCDGCGMGPLTGARFKCMTCSDYDLCEDCERRGTHNSDHPFTKYRTPVSPGQMLREHVSRTHRRLGPQTPQLSFPSLSTPDNILEMFHRAHRRHQAAAAASPSSSSTSTGSQATPSTSQSPDTPARSSSPSFLPFWPACPTSLTSSTTPPRSSTAPRPRRHVASGRGTTTRARRGVSSAVTSSALSSPTTPPSDVSQLLTQIQQSHVQAMDAHNRLLDIQQQRTQQGLATDAANETLLASHLSALSAHDTLMGNYSQVIDSMGLVPNPVMSLPNLHPSGGGRRRRSSQSTGTRGAAGPIRRDRAARFTAARNPHTAGRDKEASPSRSQLQGFFSNKRGG